MSSFSPESGRPQTPVTWWGEDAQPWTTRRRCWTRLRRAPLPARASETTTRTTTPTASAHWTKLPWRRRCMRALWSEMVRPQSHLSFVLFGQEVAEKFFILFYWCLVCRVASLNWNVFFAGGRQECGENKIMNPKSFPGKDTWRYWVIFYKHQLRITKISDRDREKNPSCTQWRSRWNTETASTKR